MTTTISSLNPAAQKMLMQFQHASSPISHAAQEAIISKATEKGQALTPDELEALLVQQMPSRADQAKQAGSGTKQAGAGSNHHCDGKVHTFMTQIVGLKIEKEQAVARVPRGRPGRPFIRDPLYSQMVVDPSTQCVLLFNARDVDKNGKPLLMKVVLREGNDASALDFSNYRTKWEDTPDVMTIPKDAAFIETKDVQEAEFNFGDPLLQVSLDAKGKETSRSVAVNPENVRITTTYPAKIEDGQHVPNLDLAPVGAASTTRGHNLDNTHVVTFMDRLAVSIAGKKNDGSAWTNTQLDEFEAKLSIDAGLMFEPDTMADVHCLGVDVRTTVPSEDSFLVGSKAVGASLGEKRQSLSQLLRDTVDITTRSNATQFLEHEAKPRPNNHRAQPYRPFVAGDEERTRIPVIDLVYPERDKVTVAGHKMDIHRDNDLKREDLKGVGISGVYSTVEGNPKGQDLAIDIGAGLVASEDGASIEGWQVCIGYTDSNRKWQGSELHTIKDAQCSEGFSLELQIPDVGDAFKATRGKFEVRVFNADGVPAQRLRVPATAFKWNTVVG